MSSNPPALLEVVPHGEQRYDTVGDWFSVPGGALRVRSSELGNWKFEFLVQLHELVEEALCRSSGVSQEAVDAFDRDGALAEPGEDPEAPYHMQHMQANAVELLVAQFLGVDPQEYTKAIEECGS